MRLTPLLAALRRYGSGPRDRLARSALPSASLSMERAAVSSTADAPGEGAGPAPGGGDARAARCDEACAAAADGAAACAGEGLPTELCADHGAARAPTVE